MKKNILIVTPIYPAKDSLSTFTPVVHYFAKEWVKLGYNVLVIHTKPVYNTLFYKTPEPMMRFIQKVFSSRIDKRQPENYLEYYKDGVKVKRINIYKVIPRSDYSSKAVNKNKDSIFSYLEESNFKPDFIMGHWDSPCLLLYPAFRKVFPNSKISLVLHGMPYLSKRKGRNNYYKGLSVLNALGFRNKGELQAFNKLFPEIKVEKFLCYSGIPDEYIERNNFKDYNKYFSKKVWNYLFVGKLIDRKYPEIVLESLANTDEKFQFNIIGEGPLDDIISRLAAVKGVSNKVNILGRLPREKVVGEMINSQCFIMISRGEAFGLVYLEAMLTGCIVVASRNEGVDGIIVDGYNGFLCEAGNKAELEEIILKIRSLPVEELKQISNNAIDTALKYTDSNMAEQYLMNVIAL